MRPRIKFLTVVWGEKYIDRFLALALPSFLAPGNLPALAEAGDVEAIVMMRQRDIDAFADAPAFQRLRSVCRLSFIPIDDLITTAIYGVTLTLAYARAVLASGSDMVGTYFVFMNADFILADGSLRALVTHIAAGRAIVLGPSFRATSEILEVNLTQRVDHVTGTLVVGQRALAAMAMKHPHPSTVAKVVNQRFLHSLEPSQFFWQVDEATLLGRYYLIFMLCLKPERPLTKVNSYSDYGFIPEMCPSGDEVVMGDSDEFFMLELQHRDHESQKLRLGEQSEAEIARSLQSWTTAEHRRAARHEVLFHARDLPADIAAAKQKACEFISRVEKRLGPPVPHAFHPHWVGGVIAFRHRRRAGGLNTNAPEMEEVPQLGQVRYGGRQKFLSLVSRAGRSIWGQPPRVRIMNPRWLDYMHLAKALGSVAGKPDANVLLVRENAESTDSLVNSDWRVECLALSKFLRSERQTVPVARRFTDAFIYLELEDFMKIPRVMRRCRSLLSEGARACYLFIHNPGGEISDDHFSWLANHVKEIAGWPIHAAPVSFVGGAFKSLNEIVFNKLARHLIRYQVLAVPWVLPMLAINLLLSTMNNAARSQALPSRHLIPHCSSFVIHASGHQEMN